MGRLILLGVDQGKGKRALHLRSLPNLDKQASVSGLY